jgi:predicted Zn-dependent protease
MCDPRRALVPVAAALALTAGHAAAIEEAEQRARIEFETQKFEELIAHSDELLDDPELNAYLQEVTDRLFPDMKGRLRVRGIRDSNFNAFAVATGGVYFHTGALLRLDDEAELAIVLGHEGTHVTADHFYRGITSAKKTSVVTLITGMAAAGFGVPPGLVSIIGYSSMAGFSREYERECDQGGYDRMIQAGYDASAAPEGFARLERELKMRNVGEGPYFFASHPRVKERVESWTELAREAPSSGERNVERYRAVTLRARVNALEHIHRQGDGKLLVFLLEDEGLLESLPPEARFYLAEGFRLRSEKTRKAAGDNRTDQEIEAQRATDAARAVEEYEKTLFEAPGFAPTWQALALHCYRAGDKPRALELFHRYVELEPDAKRNGYARQYIDSLSKELEP